MLARAHQDAVWDRMQIASKLRSVLRQYYPSFLAAFPDLASREARATLHLARPGMPTLQGSSTMVTVTAIPQLPGLRCRSIMDDAPLTLIVSGGNPGADHGA